MKKLNTLAEVLTEQIGSGKTVRFIEGTDVEIVVSIADLATRALRFLGTLQRRGMEPDDELIILSGSNERFLVAFWAAVFGGIVPVPIAPGINDEQRLKLFRIAGQLRKATLFTEDALAERLKSFAADQGLAGAATDILQRCVTDIDNVSGSEGEVQQRSPDDLAFIQYSSGSTSEPKGVCLTHRNLTSTLYSMAKCLVIRDGDVALSWMPLTHDMGLIGYHMTFLHSGVDHIIMDTGLFVRRPLLWLSKASELHATILCSPNFGYKHYLKMFERKAPDDMDLAHVRLILNGAEPISVALCEEFLQLMAPFGLKRTAMCPVYGLAEATLALTFPELEQSYSKITVKRHSLRMGEPYQVADNDDDDAVRFVKLGGSIEGCEYRIADDEDAELPDGCVGNIQIRGENITSGLYRDPETTKTIFTQDGWLKTGDCGVRADGELVVTGRAKDIVIVNGQNYYPHDIEEIIAKIDELELGKVVVGGAKRPGHPVEELLVFVLHRKDVESLFDLSLRIRDIVGTRTGLEVDHIIPVPRIPKTTSGKVRRSKLTDEYLDGNFDEVISELHALAAPNAVTGGDEGEDPLVAELLTICAEFSHDRKITADDNLFEIGISSLTLTEIILAVEEKHPGNIDINDLFDHPTIRDLSAYLAAKS